MEENMMISVNLNERSFSISGTPEFINEQKEELMNFVAQNCGKIITDATNQDNVKDKAQSADDTNNTQNKYVKGGLYCINEDTSLVSVLKKVPGNTNAAKIKNIALIVAYAKKGKILSSEVKDVCIKHSCFDKKNFSTIMGGDFTNFIKGTGTNWSLELTIPGYEAAERVLEEMLNVN